MNISRLFHARTPYDGAKIYSRCLLECYDFLIYKILSPYVWRCDPQHFFDLYKKYMSDNHADIGVGTGYFLNQCAYQPGQVRIGLFDLQPNCLEYTARRLARFQPETIQCNALEPIRFDKQPFDSIALGGILHCIPGNLTEKGRVFDSIKTLLQPGTRVFGYTILNQEIRKTLLSRLVYCLLHQLRVINGKQDSTSQLSSELRQRFAQVNIQVIGCIALFSATQPLPNK